MKKILMKSLSIALVMSLIFSCSAAAATSAKETNSIDSISNMNEVDLIKLKERLAARETELDERERQLNEREAALEKREKGLATEKTSSILVDGGNLKRIGNVTNEQVAAVQNGFNQLPSLVQEAIVAANYRVEVTDENIEKLITGGGTNSWYGASAGAPLWVILIGNNQKTTDMTRTMIHECGHCYDEMLGWWSTQQTWKSCYAAEGKTLYDTALVHNEKEWFAECFVFYLTNPDYLKTIAPVSANTIDALFKGLYELNGRTYPESKPSTNITYPDSEDIELKITDGTIDKYKLATGEDITDNTNNTTINETEKRKNTGRVKTE